MSNFINTNYADDYSIPYGLKGQYYNKKDIKFATYGYLTFINYTNTDGELKLYFGFDHQADPSVYPTECPYSTDKISRAYSKMIQPDLEVTLKEITSKLISAETGKTARLKKDSYSTLKHLSRLISILLISGMYSSDPKNSYNLVKKFSQGKDFKCEVTELRKVKLVHDADHRFLILFNECEYKGSTRFFHEYYGRYNTYVRSETLWATAGRFIGFSLNGSPIPQPVVTLANDFKAQDANFLILNASVLQQDFNGIIGKTNTVINNYIERL